jgi:hypothetical protein
VYKSPIKSDLTRRFEQYLYDSLYIGKCHWNSCYGLGSIFKSGIAMHSFSKKKNIYFQFYQSFKPILKPFMVTQIMGTPYFRPLKAPTHIGFYLATSCMVSLYCKTNRTRLSCRLIPCII